MTTKNEIKGLLATAIRRERDAAAFYRDMEQRATRAATKSLFARLAEDEIGHERFLESCTAQPAMLAKMEAGPDFGVTDTADLPPITADMPLVDAVALAMKKEQQAMELYQGLASASGDAKLKATFQGLAKMELGHKNQLEALFVNTAYPEVF